MKGHRFAGVLLLCLLTAAGVASSVVYSAGRNGAVDPAMDAPLFRIFLTDGTSLVSYGELARLDEDRVVFSMPTSASADNPQLHLINISAERIDWRKTVDYAESARAARYLATRAETDYALLTSRVEQMLNSVALTSDAHRRLTIVEGARKVLADWPADHYNYKLDEIRQMLSMLDEAIADLRAATGAQRFDLALVAAFEPPKHVPLLPPPTAREVIEQTLAAARLADSAAERTSLLSVALASLDRDAKALPGEWAAATKVSTSAKLAHETQIDRTYQVFSARILKTASDRARSADVRGVQQLMSQVQLEDKTLGELRPDAVISLLAAVEERLDAARRLRLERDRWVLKLPDLRRYRSSVNPLLRALGEIETELEDIKSLAGSGPDALGSILRASERIMKEISTIKPPDDLREAHGLLVSAAQLAANAAKIRREAALTANMTRAWDASSAAAGALMLAGRVQTDMQNAFRAPQLPR
jgi:hypothetical protein